MAATASHCRPLRRMPLTKRVSPATAAGAVPGLAVVTRPGISELEINECAAFGREKAEIDNDQHGEADAHGARLEELLAARLEGELIQPDQPDQQQHERGHLRGVPGAAEEARE